MNNLDILLIIKNGEVYLKNYFNKIVNRLNKFNNLKFYIYENNSTDSTKNFYLNFINTQIFFNIKTENIKNYINLNVNNINLINKRYLRYKKILDARNELHKFYKNNILLQKNINNLTSQWILLSDIDIIYNNVTVEKLFEKINEYPDGVMFCANKIILIKIIIRKINIMIY